MKLTRKFAAFTLAGALLCSGAPAFAEEAAPLTTADNTQNPTAAVNTAVPAITSTTTGETTVWANQAQLGFTLAETLNYENLQPNSLYAIRANIIALTSGGTIDYDSGAVYTSVDTFTTSDTGAGQVSQSILVPKDTLGVGTKYAIVWTISYDNLEGSQLVSVNPSPTAPQTGEQDIVYTDLDNQVLDVKALDLLHGAKEALDVVMPVWSTARSVQTGITIYNTLASTTAAQSFSTATGSSLGSLLGFVGSTAGTALISSSALALFTYGSLLAAEIGGMMNTNQLLATGQITQ
ncbi:MAG: hypothetical protein Q3962_03955 [Corynebacterium sp.]|nr:hypothetical protein [Corynebacterium sp.]